MQIEIDPNAGFCFGVTNAINKAEAEIAENGSLYCLGEMVHNQEETSRLSRLGMTTISYSEYENLKDTTVLLRAHGEPPRTYETAKGNNVRIIDATCPIVLRLHKLIYENAKNNPDCQTVIYGKKDHAEVVGLVGQVEGNATVISSENEIHLIDFNKGILLYSQTTMNSHKYDQIADSIKEKAGSQMVKKFNTVCRSVAQRERNLASFAEKFSAILFVAGSNSSNGKYLYSTCKKYNPHTYYISNAADISPDMLLGIDSVGITGATSTPKWLLQQIADSVAKKAQE